MSKPCAALVVPYSSYLIDFGVITMNDMSLIASVCMVNKQGAVQTSKQQAVLQVTVQCWQHPGNLVTALFPHQHNDDPCMACLTFIIACFLFVIISACSSMEQLLVQVLRSTVYTDSGVQIVCPYGNINNFATHAIMILYDDMQPPSQQRCRMLFSMHGKCTVTTVRIACCLQDGRYGAAFAVCYTERVLTCVSERRPSYAHQSHSSPLLHTLYV